MRRKNIILAVLLALALTFQLTAGQAVPACPFYFNYTEPDTGIEVRVRQYGDESFHYMADTQDQVIVLWSGLLWYVEELNGEFILGARVTETNDAPDGQRVLADDDRIQEQLTVLRDALPGLSTYSLRRSYTEIPNGYDIDDANPTGRYPDAARGMTVAYDYDDLQGIEYAPKAAVCPLLVLRVQYDNVKSAFTDAEWHDTIFDNGVSDYYSKISNGLFTYVPATENVGSANDGVALVTLPIEAPCYAADDPNNLSVFNGIMAGLYTGSDSQSYAIYNESSLLSYGLLAIADRMDFAAYDRDGNGYIAPTELAVLVVAAGYEIAFCGPSAGVPGVWAHSALMNDYLLGRPGGYGRTIRVDGVELYKYTIMGENASASYDYYTQTGSARQMSFGTACHELAHDLGIKDLYDTRYQGLEKDVGCLSLMANGSWGYVDNYSLPGSSPVHLDPYDKIWLGFYQADTATRTGDYVLSATEPSVNYHILRVNTADPNVYYLIENRQLYGYDEGMKRIMSRQLSTGGILVWRIDQEAVRLYWSSNSLNNHEGRYAIMPEFLDVSNSFPFWGGTYLSRRETLILQDKPKIELTFNGESSLQMRVHLAIEGTEPTPVTGDTSRPLAWTVCALLSLGAMLLLLNLRKASRSNESNIPS